MYAVSDVNNNLRKMFILVALRSGLFLSGFSGIRHLMWIIYIVLFLGRGWTAYSNPKARLSAVLMIPLLLLLIASFVNDGTSHFPYPPSLSASYQKYDTPALKDTLAEIGYGSAALTLFINSLIIFGVPAILVFVLYLLKNCFEFPTDYGVYAFVYLMHCFTIFVKFIFTDLAKMVLLAQGSEVNLFSVIWKSEFLNFVYLCNF